MIYDPNEINDLALSTEITSHSNHVSVLICNIP